MNTFLLVVQVLTDLKYRIYTMGRAGGYHSKVVRVLDWWSWSISRSLWLSFFDWWLRMKIFMVEIIDWLMRTTIVITQKHTCQLSRIRHRSPGLPHKIELWAPIFFQNSNFLWFIVRFLGYFCTYFITDKDYLANTIITPNCGLYSMSDLI